MAIQPGVAMKEAQDSVQQLLAALEQQSPDVTTALYDALRAKLEGRAPGVVHLTGLSLRARTGAAEVAATDGAKMHLTPERAHVVVPVSLRAAATPPGVPAHARPFARSLLCVKIVAGEQACQIELDAAPLYRSWAQWGPMQLVTRQQDADGRLSCEPLDGTTAHWALAPHEAREIFGVGFAPRLDPASVFGPMARRAR